MEDACNIDFRSNRKPIPLTSCSCAWGHCLARNAIVLFWLRGQSGDAVGGSLSQNLLIKLRFHVFLKEIQLALNSTQVHPKHVIFVSILRFLFQFCQEDEDVDPSQNDFSSVNNNF